MALIPFLAVVLATFQYFSNLESLYPMVEKFLLSHFREAVGSEATKWIRILLRNIQNQSLGLTGTIFLLLTSLKLLHEMDYAIHRVWAISNSRPLYKRIFFYWLMIFLIPMGLALYTGLNSLVETKAVQRLTPEWFTNGILLFGILYLIGKYVPAVKVRSLSALWGAIFSGIGMLITQKVFKLLAASLFTHNKIYGSLVSLPLLLLWILTLWYVFLGGIAFTASLERKKLDLIPRNPLA